MNAIFLVASLVCSAQPLEDGTLLFLENANSVVKVATRDKIGHVAMLLTDDGQQWVYEATPARVRRVTPDAYYEEIARINARRDDEEDRIRVTALRPKQPYTDAEKKAIGEFLESQLGRRYSVLNYVKNEEGDGIHCAELAGGALNASGRYEFKQPRSIHPAKFYELLEPTHQPAETISLPDAARKETWCQRADRRWGEVWRWTCWGCGEAWAFCW